MRPKSAHRPRQIREIRLATRRRAAKARPRATRSTQEPKRTAKPAHRPGRPAATSRLQLRARQHAAIAALGERALSGIKPVALMDEAVQRLRTALEVEYVKVCELVGDGPHFIVRAGSGWKPGTVGNPALAEEGDTQANYTLRADRPVIVTDVARESRFTTQPLLAAHHVVSGISVVIRGRDGPYGVLAAHSTRRRRFSDDDASVLVSAANILGLALDRDRSDSQLRESEGRLRAFFDNSPLLLNLRAPDGRYLMVNRHYREVFGVTPKQLVGKLGEAIYPTEYAQHSAEIVQRVARTRRAEIYEHEVPTPDGRRTFVTTRFPITGGDGAVSAVGTIAPDVTALRVVEAENRHYRDLLEGVTDTIPVALAYVDADGIYRWINRRGAERLGHPREHIIGRSMREIFGDERWNESLRLKLERVLGGDTITYERTSTAADGSQLQIEMHLTPALGPDGRVEGMCLLAIDVTERQRARAALQQSHDELERRVAERTGQLEAAHHEAEALSYSIAHDLRAPLRAISGYARILIEEVKDGLSQEAHALLERIGVNAERMGTLIDALLGFGHLSRQPLQRSKVRLDDVVEDALGWMHAEMNGRNVDVKRGRLGQILADPALMRIALTNLLSNAIKFTRGRDPALIEIGRTTLDKEAVYYVRDNGAGFDMRYASKLFGMFQRLHGHARFEGSGVGLASVQQIVQRHGGRIWAESEEGEGATFYFTLAAREM